MNMERRALRLLSGNGDALREALYSNQKAVALETGAVTTAITPREQRWPRSISIPRCLEEPQMTVTMEDSQSVVMKKRMPELERLQLRKEKREGGGGGRRRPNSSATSKTNPRTAQMKGCGPFLPTIPPSLPYCAPTTCRHCARCGDYRAEQDEPFCKERHSQRSAPQEVQAAWNKEGEPMNFGMKEAQETSERKWCF